AFGQLESNTFKNQAIEIYQRILDNFPAFDARDKVHFFLAHEYRELGKIDEMVMQYRVIIKEYKSSPYVPEAYLLLGDYFINQQDLDMAIRHYTAVLDHPESAAIAIARYKLAWCHINNAEFKKAIKLFEEAVKSTPEGRELDVDTYRRVDIRTEALMDMAYCYPECYRDSAAEAALSYFREYAWSRQVYTEVLEKLAYRFYIKKRLGHAAHIYRQLSSLQHDPDRLLEYARNIFDCVKSEGTFENADQDMAIIIKALKEERYCARISDEQKKKDTSEYELYARNIVTYLHDKARKKRSLSDFSRCADAYRLYLEFFTDSPALAEMESNYAEALFSCNEYLEAGKHYEKLVTKGLVQEKDRESRLYGAVISYYHALKNKDDLNYFEIAYARDGLKTTGKLYASDFPESAHVPDVLFNVAWISYDAGRYDEAIEEFSGFIRAYPKGKPASAAVHLILDSYNLKEDYEGLIRYGKEIINNKSITDQALKGEVALIVQATESKILSTLTIAALDDWETGRSDLLNFASKSISAGMGEQALSALIVSSKEKADLRTLITAGDDFIRRYPSSSRVEESFNLMIDAAIRSCQMRLLAGYLESFAGHLPKHDNTGDFLVQAGRLRENLGQYDLSSRDYEKLISLGKTDAGLLEETVFAMADNALHLAEPDEAIRMLKKYRKNLSKTGTVRADARIADLSLALENTGDAKKYRDLAYKGYKPSMADKDPQLCHDMAQMSYHATRLYLDRYMRLSLGNRINNKVVSQKAKLLEMLEKGYQSVMQYKSPKWALLACHDAYVINQEFARFLVQAPIPELTAQEAEQYAAIIASKAAAYENKAKRYEQTCMEQAHKWEVCDPELTGLYAGLAGRPFCRAAANVDLDRESLRDERLLGLHVSLLKDPEDSATLMELVLANIEGNDYRQAILIAGRTLSENSDLGKKIIADLHNCIGVSRLYLGQDSQAKESFRRALESDPGHTGALINLAGLLSHYRHSLEAKQIYNSLISTGQPGQITDLIHPQAKEYYYESIQISKK
ncbi:MAG TPA: tetratricopeptide repeat protein, partial [Deltaproteobacteria bacterium]|nr:tetratricopeptide repeat protein [Deltaproteobacteria bacterium]